MQNSTYKSVKYFKKGNSFMQRYKNIYLGD